MKYFAVLTTLLLGATATPVRQRQTTQAKISGFSASTNTNGDGATIGYNFEIAGLVSTHCGYSDEISESKLPNVQQTLCDDPAVRWQFRQDPSLPGTQGRYRIVVIYTPTSGAGAAGFHEWAASDFPLDTDETVYQGASDFIVDMA
ncbi:hypothetical protein E0Z10_g10364 [Xylaria hypoxylon]|uniref:AA1-like domain-containing protein n=1 Tax=Xylaria hypoxylon TaxID=37992 RepID=A0A4Z0Y694_9PEZI|nr:hypothetical protein E0Z10_g10364 [Xylaria hypoxylon]